MRTLRTKSFMTTSRRPFGRTSLGRPVIGTNESLSRIDREKVLSYYQRHYCPSNLVVALAGNFQYQEAVDLIGVALSSLRPGSIETKITAPQARSGLKSFYRDLEQVQICMGVPALSLYNDKIYALQILNNILGGGASSRLFQQIREERALVYAIYSYYLAFLDSGLFTIYGGTNPANCQQVLDLSWEEINKIMKSGVTEKELSRAKTQVKGSLLIAQESVLQRMHRLGRSELVHQRFITIEEVLERIAEVNAADIQALTRELFAPENVTVTVLGPMSEGQIKHPSVLCRT